MSHSRSCNLPAALAATPALTHLRIEHLAMLASAPSESCTPTPLPSATRQSLIPRRPDAPPAALMETVARPALPPLPTSSQPTRVAAACPTTNTALSAHPVITQPSRSRTQLPSTSDAQPPHERTVHCSREERAPVASRTPDWPQSCTVQPRSVGADELPRASTPAEFLVRERALIWHRSTTVFPRSSMPKTGSAVSSSIWRMHMFATRSAPSAQTMTVCVALSSTVASPMPSTVTPAQTLSVAASRNTPAPMTTVPRTSEAKASAAATVACSDGTRKIGRPVSSIGQVLTCNRPDEIS